jgi:hypothetical protein
MVYFISRENQDLLWNVAHKNTFIGKYLQNIHQDNKYVWFRNIIGIFHDKYGSNDLTVQQLQQINKETIKYMIQTIQSKRMSTQTNQSNQMSHSIQTPPIPTNTRQEEYANQFELRQKEYNQMIEKKTPTELDFRENFEKDEPIQDIKALMQRHMQERDNDISWQRETPMLTIDNSSNVTIQTETIQEKDNPKKSVTWKDNENYEEKYKLLQENYCMLQEEFMQMKNKIAESI